MPRVHLEGWVSPGQWRTIAQLKRLVSIADDKNAVDCVVELLADGSVVLRDRDTATPTLLNEVPVTGTHLLRHGDIIRSGSKTIRVQIEGTSTTPTHDGTPTSATAAVIAEATPFAPAPQPAAVHHRADASATDWTDPREHLATSAYNVFISCVTREFERDSVPRESPGGAWDLKHVFPGLRTALVQIVGNHGGNAIFQERFPNGMDTDLLDHLHECVLRSAIVVHLIGVRAGYPRDDHQDWFKPGPEELRHLFARIAREKTHQHYEDIEDAIEAGQAIARRAVGASAPRWEELSYTQWEAWLALIYDRSLYTYNISQGKLRFDQAAIRDVPTDTSLADRELQSQQNHFLWLLPHRSPGTLNRDTFDPDRWDVSEIPDPAKRTEHLRLRLVESLSVDLPNRLTELKHLRNQRTQQAALALFQAGFAPQSVEQTTAVLLHRRTEFSAPFYGRDWLHAQLEDWLTSEQKCFWLEADAGFGKTRFAAKLAAGWDRRNTVPVYAVEFLEPHRPPLEFFKSIYRQLRTQPAIAPALNKAWDNFDWAHERLESVATLSAEEQERLLLRLAEQLLFQPLRDQAVPSEKTTDGVILIDGLDELIEWQEGKPYHPLAQFLERLLSKSMTNVRVLLMSRPVQRLYAELAQLSSRIQPRHVLPDLPGMTDDASRMIRAELADFPEWQTDEAVQLLISSSRSSMLYLHYVLPEVRLHQWTPEQARDQKLLPLGMAAYYARRMHEYFPDDSAYHARFVRQVRPCLNVIMAGGSLGIAVADVEACCSAKAVQEMRSSLRMMIREHSAPLLVEQSGTRNGASIARFAPFHLSFFDWLTNREFTEGSDGDEDDLQRHATTDWRNERFSVSELDGQELLANWAWEQYLQLFADADKNLRHPQDGSTSTLPTDEDAGQEGELARHEYNLRRWKCMPIDPLAFWTRHGVSLMLAVFMRRVHAPIPTAIEPGQAADYEFLMLKRAVAFMGWLLHGRVSQKSQPLRAALLATSLPRLQAALAETVRNEERLLDPSLIRQLTPIDQVVVYELVREICSTDLTEEFIAWIGRTQLDTPNWQFLVAQMVAQDEYVVRQAAGVGQAARHTLQSTPDLPEAELETVCAEIEQQLSSTNADLREVGATAVVEIVRDLLLSGDSNPREFGWLKQLSDDPEFDFHFTQTALGDLLIDLSLQIFADPDPTRREIRLDYLRDWLDTGYFARFWQPLWQYNRQDVIRVLSIWNEHAAGILPCPSSVAEPFMPEAQAYGELLRRRAATIESFAENPQNGDDPTRARLREILYQPDLDSRQEHALNGRFENIPELRNSDSDFILDWLLREDAIVEDRIQAGVQYLRLMFSHVAWRMIEGGAQVLASLATRPGGEEFACLLLRALRASLVSDPPELPRVVMGVAESCYLARHLHYSNRDDDVSNWLESMIDEPNYYGSPCCDVRALLAQNVAILAHERIVAATQPGGDQQAIVYFLTRHQQPLLYWFADRDIWVLEQIHQLFREIYRAVLRQPDGVLSRWLKRISQKMAQQSDALMLQAGTVDRPWYAVSRTEFLQALQQYAHQHPYAPAARVNSALPAPAAE